MNCSKAATHLQRLEAFYKSLAMELGSELSCRAAFPKLEVVAMANGRNSVFVNFQIAEMMRTAGIAGKEENSFCGV